MPRLQTDKEYSPLETAGSRRGESWKWWICGILFLATVLNYLDRQTVAICKVQVCEEFHLSEMQFGELLAAFRWTYAAVHAFAGWFADRFSVRIVYALAVGVWSAAGAAAAFVTTPGALAMTRRVLGAGEAFNWPCAMRITANLLPPQDRSLGNGVFTSGSAVGALVAPLIIAPLAAGFGWRMAFLVVGCLGFGWLVLWWLATRRAPQIETYRTDADAPEPSRERVPLGRQLTTLLTHPGFWLLAIVSATLNPCFYFCADWIPGYMFKQRAFGFVAAALVTTPVFLGADVGNIAGGALVKVLAGRGWSIRGARGVAVVAGGVLILPVAVASYVTSPWLCIALLTSAAIGLMCVTANYLACAQEISFASVGLVGGVLGVFGNVVSALVNPWIGRYVDVTGNYHLVFVLLGIIPMIGVGTILLFDSLLARRQPSTR